MAKQLFLLSLLLPLVIQGSTPAPSAAPAASSVSASASASANSNAFATNPANFSSAAGDQKETKAQLDANKAQLTVASASESDWKSGEIHLDLSQLPDVLKKSPYIERITPPSNDELTQAYDRASKAKSEIGMLIELCKPYRGKDIDYFDVPVFKKWKKLCAEKVGTRAQPGSDPYILARLPYSFQSSALWGLIARDWYSTTPGIIWRELDHLRTTEVSDVVAWSFQYGGYRNTLAELGSLVPSTVDPLVLRCIALAGLARPAQAAWLESDHAPDRSKHVMSLHRNHYSDSRLVAMSHMKYVQQTNRYLSMRSELSKTLAFPAELEELIATYEVQKLLTLQEAISVRKPLTDWWGWDLYAYMIGDLAGLNNLRDARSLLLSGNQISVLRSDDFAPSQLQKLTMRDNGLLRIAPHAFARQDQLRELDLSDNRLTALTADALQGLSNLQSLCVSGNQIETIEPGVLLQLNCLEKIYLEGNPLQVIPADLKELALKGKLRTIYLPEQLKNTQEAQEILAIAKKNLQTYCEALVAAARARGI